MICMCAFSVVRVAINVFMPCSVGSQTTGYWSVFTLRGCGPSSASDTSVGKAPECAYLAGLSPERLCSNRVLPFFSWDSIIPCFYFLFPSPK